MLVIGDKVRIKQPFVGRYCIGTIVNIDGWHVYIKMNYKGIIIHRYPNEIIKENK